MTVQTSGDRKIWLKGLERPVRRAREQTLDAAIDPLLPFVALGSGRSSAAFYVEGLFVST